MKHLVFWIALGLVAPWPALTLAQTRPLFERAKPSAEQLRLMDEGARAYGDKDYARAAGFYRQALALGELNVAYLNLGRLMQKQGECQLASEAYGKALVAPAMEAPSPEQVRASITRYRQELAQTCPGVLLVQCLGADMSLRLDNRPIPCDYPVEKPAGRYTLEISQGAVRRKQEVALSAAQTLEVKASLPASSTPLDPTEPEPPQDTPGQALNLRGYLGWGLVGAGAVSALAGGYFTLQVLENNSDVEALAQQPLIDPIAARDLFDRGGRFNSAQFIFYGLGAVLGLAGGFVLGFSDIYQSPPEERSGLGLSVQPGGPWSVWWSVPLE